MNRLIGCEQTHIAPASAFNLESSSGGLNRLARSLSWAQPKELEAEGLLFRRCIETKIGTEG